MRRANHDAPRSVSDVDLRPAGHSPDAGQADYPELKQVVMGDVRHDRRLYLLLTMPNVFIYDFSYWDRSFIPN